VNVRARITECMSLDKGLLLDLQIHNFILAKQNTITRDRVRRTNATTIRSRSIF